MHVVDKISKTDLVITGGFLLLLVIFPDYLKDFHIILVSENLKKKRVHEKLLRDVYVNQ